MGITDESWEIIEEYAYDIFGQAFIYKDLFIEQKEKWKVWNEGDDEWENIWNKDENDKSNSWEFDDISWGEEIQIQNKIYTKYNGKWIIWNVFLYTGREFDKEIGLYYNRARYYSSDLWRFISRDPVWQIDDINLYAYVGNNPVMFVDLMGKAKDAIIKLFKQSGEEIEAYLYFYDIPFINNNLETLLNKKYFNMEYKWNIWPLKSIWKYDLAMWWYQLSDRYDEDWNWNIEFVGEQLSLWEISNVLAWLNSYRFWFSKGHLEYWAMKTVEWWGGNWIEWELADRKLYDYWYKLWELEKKNWWLTNDDIIKHIKEATISRQNYLNKK